MVAAQRSARMEPAYQKFPGLNKEFSRVKLRKWGRKSLFNFKETSQHHIQISQSHFQTSQCHAQTSEQTLVYQSEREGQEEWRFLRLKPR